ncbi:MAG: DUF2275 domain-containing protein [Deltaproteobacteria bacterium]|nr:DUF2275 domain-containing protein [Deltaproteobacteria bacterium]
MTCNEIRILLPAYLESALPEEEMGQIGDHLKDCALCSKEFGNLKKAADLVRDLPELEPPPFFEQRIMARVRQEAAQKKGLWQKIFYPLHIKIPVQAMATVLIAALAFYVYQGGDPQIKQITPLPMESKELKTGEKTEAMEDALKAPQVKSPASRGPDSDTARKAQPPYAPPPPATAGKQEMKGGVQIPLQNEPQPVMKSVSPPLSVGEKKIRQSAVEGLGRAADRDASEESRMPHDSTLREETKDKAAATGIPVGQSRAMKAAAPSPSKSTLETTDIAAAADFTIQVDDAANAYGAIKKILDQTGGRMMERQRRSDGDFFKIEIPGQNIGLLYHRLEEMGAAGRFDKSLAPSEETAVFRILVVVQP